VRSLDDISRLTGAQREYLRDRFGQFTFLECDGEGRVSYVSEPFRRYAANRLADLRKKVEDVVISDLFARKEEKEAAAMLPTALHQAARYDQLLQYLTPGHFEAAIKMNESVTPIKRQIDFGVQAALASGRDGELVRFSIHKSTLVQLESADVWKAEVEARIALDDFATAESLANAVRLKEDRLHLLAVIAKGRVKRGLTQPPELLETVRSLYGQIDRQHLGDRALEIAADLVYCAPSLAVEMVEEASSQDSGRADLAMATLALATPKDVLPRVDGDIAKKIRERIRSPQLRAFIEETQVRTRDTTAQDVLSQVKLVNLPERKLFFLRQWALQNRRREDAWEVVEAGLDLAIRSTEYTPNARDIRELASPLPFIESAECLRRLTAKFTANRGNIERHGPTVDYVRLLLLLARGEYRHDATRGGSAFCDAYLYTTDIKDLGVRAECFARLIVCLDATDPARELEKTDRIHTLAEKGLTEAVDALRGATALHDTVFSGILGALAGTRVDLAADIALSLNTEPRRDGALVEVIVAAFGTGDPPVGFVKARELIEKIKDPDQRDDAVFKVLDCTKRRKEIPVSWGTEVRQFLNLAKLVGDPEVRTDCFACIYCVLKRSESSGSADLCDTLFKNMEASLGEIDVGWEKVRAAFEASALLAPLAATHARQLLTLAESAKQSTLLQTENAAKAYIGTIFLAFSAFVGLLRRRLTDENDICRLADLIDRVPSYGERARTWAELALRVHAAGEHTLCQNIVSQRVRPLLQKLQTEFGSQALNTLAAVLPAIYSAFPVPALGEFASLPPGERDRTYYLTCRYLFRGRTRYEPFEDLGGKGYDIGYEQATEICEIIGRIDQDDAAYYLIKDLVDSLASNRRRAVLSREQMSELAGKIERLGTTKFPNPRHITHNGYLICVRALVERLRKPSAAVWDGLASEARSIPNVSDRVFVLCCIAGACQSKEPQKARQLFTEADSIAKTIACVYDRVARQNMVAKEAWGVDRAFAKQTLQSTMKVAVDNDNEDLLSLQSNMLDFAHRVDPELAASLAALADTDPARSRTRLTLRQQLDRLRSTKELAAEPDQRDHSSVQRDHYPQAAWRLLGQLNARMAANRKPEALREFAEVAASLPFTQAYPILALVIGNAVSRFSDTDQARSILRPMFEATLLASQIAARMADQNNRVALTVFTGVDSSTDTLNPDLIKAGQREVAVRRIEHWIAEKVGEYLTISDPFFGPDDLEVLKMILAIKPGTKVRVLTSLKHQKQEQVAEPYAQTYIQRWRSDISSQDPPDTEIAVVGTKTGDSPIHDRWWLTAGGGLRMGTSFRSIGVEKDAELSELAAETAAAFEQQVNGYLRRDVREHRGERLSYQAFALD
jgi:hypothetical protein